jgi:hypothetical protein
VNDYLGAQAVATSQTAAIPPGASPDPILVAAAAAQLEAIAAQAAAQQRFAQARHRIGQIAIALYLGDQVPRAGAALVGTSGSLDDRSAFLARVLDAEQGAAKLAKAELVRTTTAATARRIQADQLVSSRTLELQNAALQAAAADRAPASTIVPAVGGAAIVTAPPSLLTQDSPTILGPTVLSAGELAGWFSASGHRPNLTVPLPALTEDYVSAGATAGVRADIAFAQSVLETGYFSFPGYGQVAVSDNNFAGIGACDSCSTGFRFKDAATGVLAQMQLLHAYATTSQPVAGPLPGPFRVAGCCATWMALTGVWATAPDYGIKILTLYRTIVEWALARRTAAAQL